MVVQRCRTCTQRVAAYASERAVMAVASITVWYLFIEYYDRWAPIIGMDMLPGWLIHIAAAALLRLLVRSAMMRREFEQLYLEFFTGADLPYFFDQLPTAVVVDEIAELGQLLQVDFWI